MNADGTLPTTAMWARTEHRLLGKATDPGATAPDNRWFLEAVLWPTRTGSPWRDLPEPFRNWNGVFKCFRRWALFGTFERMFNASRNSAFRTAFRSGP